jgi:hypothetical protein
MEKQNAKVTSGGMISRLFRIAVAAAAAVTVCAGLAVAQDDDVEEFNQERVRKMRDAAPEESSFDGVFDSAPTPTPAEAKPPEFIPKNEVTVVQQKTDTTAVKEKAGAKSGKLTNAVGGRVVFAFGSTITLNVGGSFKIGLGESTRIDAGVDFGFASPGENGYWMWGSEMTGFIEKRFSISDDGVFSWFAGPGLAIGLYSAEPSKKKKDIDTSAATDAGPGFGVGFQAGLEVNLSFIDPDHSLYKLKNASLSLDVRPMFYLAPEKYPWFILTTGLAFRYAF